MLRRARPDESRGLRYTQVETFFFIYWEPAPVPVNIPWNVTKFLYSIKRNFGSRQNGFHKLNIIVSHTQWVRQQHSGRL